MYALRQTPQVSPVGGDGFGTNDHVSLAYASNVVAGDLLVLVGYLSVPKTMRGSVSDTQGNVWEPATAPVESADAGDTCVQIFYTVAGSSGANTVTFTATGFNTDTSSTYYFRLFNFDGGPATSPEDGTGATGAGVAGVSINVTTPNSLIIAGAVNNSGNGGLTAQAGYTEGPTPRNSYMIDDTEYRVDAPAGANTVGFTNFVNYNGALAVAAFTPAAMTSAAIGASDAADAAAIVVGGAPRSVSLTLVTSPTDATPKANLTGLNWAFFDVMPWLGAGAAPVNVGTGATTDPSGVFAVSLTRTTLASGATGYLIVTDSDGAVADANNAFAGPVTIS